MKSPVVGASAPTILSLKVNIELDTLDQLRKVMFGLEKDTDGSNVAWTIHFQLQERETESDRFTNLVTLDVTVDETLHPAAEIAAKDGLTTSQSAHALGPAADDAKDSTTGDLDPADARQTVQKTLAS